MSPPRATPQRRPIRRAILAAATIAAGLASWIGVAPAGATVTPTAASQSASRFSYCADRNRVFTDAHPFVGLTDPLAGVISPTYLDCTMGRLAASHIGYFRLEIAWDYVEAVPGTYNFSFADAMVAAIAKHHMRTLGELFGAPKIFSNAPAQGGSTNFYPPSSAAHFGYFAFKCAKRYGPGGTFWHEHPRLPYLPIRAWQVWNEPNLVQNWEPRVSPGAYVRLLRATYHSIKKVDRHATVVTAGMPFFGARDETRFLTQLFHRGLRGNFDALSVHAYAPTVQSALQRLTTARGVLNRFGESRLPLWVTEFGWAGGPPNSYIVSQRGQRRNVAAFLALIQRYRAKLRLRELMWYSWRDHVYGPGPNYWGWHLGFLTTGLRPKLGLQAFATGAERLDR